MKCRYLSVVIVSIMLSSHGLSACTPTVVADAASASTPSIITQPAVQPPTATHTPNLAIPTSLPPITTQKPIPTTIPFQICSPLEYVALDDLKTRINNAYNPPPPGSDAPHQGVDLAEYFGENRIAIEGQTVNAVLKGRVATVIADRFPYGNAIIIETPFENLPPEWLITLQLPTHPPEINPDPALTCPPMADVLSNPPRISSLYLLYAHLQSSPGLQVGDTVACGQPLGAIGTSGNALNPHLHLEVRAGPSRAQFSSLAHYDPSATEDEMRNYCIWRISGLFSLLDPLILFAQQNEDGE